MYICHAYSYTLKKLLMVRLAQSLNICMAGYIILTKARKEKKGSGLVFGYYYYVTMLLLKRS